MYDVFDSGKHAITLDTRGRFTYTIAYSPDGDEPFFISISFFMFLFFLFLFCFSSPIALMVIMASTPLLWTTADGSPTPSPMKKKIEIFIFQKCWNIFEQVFYIFFSKVLKFT